MTVIERPLYPELSVEAEVLVPTAAVVIYSNSNATTSGWTSVLTANGSGATAGGVGSSSTGTTPPRLTLVSTGGTTSVNPTPGVTASRTITGLTPGKSYTFSCNTAPVSSSMRTRMTFGTATTPWVTAPTETFVSGSFVATSTSATLTLEAVDNPDSTGARSQAFGYFDNLNITQDAYVTPVWTPLLADATGISIRRGGSRDGLGVRTDVGLCTFTLLDAQDPLDGGVLAPGMPVRVRAGTNGNRVAGEVLLSEGFEGTVDLSASGWTTGSPGTVTVVSDAKTGTKGLRLQGQEWLDYPVDYLNLEGVTVTVSAWVKGPVGLYVAPSHAMYIDFDSQEYETPMTGSWVKVSHTGEWWPGTNRYLEYAVYGTVPVDVVFDDISITVTDVRTPIFTGRIAFLNSSYPLDKNTGTSRAVVQVTAADAVQIHTSTQRYGVDMGVDTDETFEERIGRLAASSQAPIEAPAIGAPREVYAF